MPKKKTKSDFRGLLREFAEKSIGIVASSIEKVNFMKIIKNMTNIKEKVKKYAISSILTIVGAVVLFLGAAKYLAYLIPQLANGFGEMIIGAVLVIVAVIVCKSGR